MDEYHGIIVDESQKDQSIFGRLNILGKKKSDDSDWILLKISVKEDDLEGIIKQLQDNMFENYYFHFYKDNTLIVVFKSRIFKITPDKSTWKEAIEHGKSLNIPEEQLDFKPCRIEDETY